jgi:hypothetical protein
VGKVDFVILATPAAKVALPSDVLPFLNVTVPVGVGPADVTVAVKVTACPYFEGLRLELSVVVVGYLTTTCVTVAELLLCLACGHHSRPQ